MGNTVFTHRWNPSGIVLDNVPGIYLLHGTGEHAGRYHRFASTLSDAGWQVGAHDHPGHGKSDGKRGLISPAGSLAVQAAIQIQAFACETGTSPIVFGHSLGGVLATELVLDYNLPVAGLVLSAPAYAPYIGKLNKLKLKLLSATAPELCLDLGYDPARLTHDEDERKAARLDELIHGYKSATFVNWLMTTGQRALHNADQLAVDTLMLIAGADPVVDSVKTRQFVRDAVNADITVHDYEGYFHELLNEKPVWRDQVALDILQWLERYR